MSSSQTNCLQYLDARNTPLLDHSAPFVARALRISSSLIILHLENASLSGRPLMLLGESLENRHRAQASAAPTCIPKHGEMTAARDRVVPMPGLPSQRCAARSRGGRSWHALANAWQSQCLPQVGDPVFLCQPSLWAVGVRQFWVAPVVKLMN